MSGKLSSVLGILVATAAAVGLALAGSQGGASVAGIPLFILCGLIAFSVQWLVFIPAYIFQTEKYYDLTGSLTYISLAILALGLSATREPGALLIASMVVIWALRLGSFLFLRIRAEGRDVRFERIKPDFLRFLMTWTLQGLWVFTTFAAGLAAITSMRSLPVDAVVAVGAGLWLLGFVIEVVADRQKRSFRKDPANRDRFIASGLWRYSRHPNYFGEILLWSGIAVAAWPALSGWQYVTLVSPLFVYWLLTRVSGIPMLEARARRRWGEDASYQAYLRETPRLIPRWRPGDR